jgi:hypothetical protein
MFSLRDDVPLHELQTVLEKIREWGGVEEADVLFPEAADANLQRLGFVNLAEGADAQKLVEQVQSLPRVEKASLAAERRLS